MKYSREIKEFFGFVRKGLPMTVAIILIITGVMFVSQFIPTLGIIIGTGAALLFSMAALGIVKDIADND